MKVLITGATGNVGLSVLKHLRVLLGSQDEQKCVWAGVRDVVRDQATLQEFKVPLVVFDFENVDTYRPALLDVDVLFLLRPPQLSDVKRYFQPLIKEVAASGVNHIVFLSVQGVEKSSVIPHHKIEKLISEQGIWHTFLRPAYFMQNFTTTLRPEIVGRSRIFLPAGNAKFAVVDADDVGKVAAKILVEPHLHEDMNYDLTNSELLTFGQMAEKLSAGLGREINYESPGLLRFYFTKRREGVAPMFILVMIMLHYLPRFQEEPRTTEWIRKLTGREPRAFDDFVIGNLEKLR